MRRVILAALTLLALSAPAAHASCADSLRFRGSWYSPTAIAVDEGAYVSGGVVPGCDDTGPSTPREPDTPVTVRRIPGLPVAVAVARFHHAYLAAGFLPQLAGHPLHRAFRVAAPTRCGPAWRTSGTVSAPPPPGVPVTVTGPTGIVRRLAIAAGTRVTGLERDGFPYLGSGDRIDAVVRSCAGATVAVRLQRA